MKRRTVLKADTLAATTGGTAVPWENMALAKTTAKELGGSLSGLLSGGTADMPNGLAPPKFRAFPQCVVTGSKMLGPCHTSNVSVRQDVTEGVTELPMRVSLRVVGAAGCQLIRGGDVET